MALFFNEVLGKNSYSEMLKSKNFGTVLKKIKKEYYFSIFCIQSNRLKTYGKI
jgi:hypothetical protein